MIEIECPKCKSKEMEEVDFDHQWLSTIDKKGCANIIYYCPKCNLSFNTWVDFKIEFTGYEWECLEDN